MKLRNMALLVVCVPSLFLVTTPLARADTPHDGAIRIGGASKISPVRLEVPDDPPATRSAVLRARTTSPASVWVRGSYTSIQVNVDSQGNNIVGDAANEPSIAVDPTDPRKIVIGWRQFDTVASNFREAGWAYSHDAGQTWTFPGVLEEDQFRSDPVLDADADGNFYFYSLSSATSVELFKSTDGGVTWTGPVGGFGGDKEWMTIDRTTGIGRGNIYAFWNVQFSCCPPFDFTRSTDGGLSFELPIAIPHPSMKWGTLDVGPDGELYLAGATLNASSQLVAKSTNAKDFTQTPSFDFVSYVDLGGGLVFSDGPNPGGLLGQVWIATDHSNGASRGNVYMLGSINPSGFDPLDVMFIRSTDGGLTWSEPVRVNDDPVETYAWQWFGTMSIAPNGRIDVIWNDTRIDASVRFSELYYSFSTDTGYTWSENVPISPSFDHSLGYPRQYKLGDYYDMVSDTFGADVAYAATFNGEQDVYYLRIGEIDCNGNGIPDADDLAAGTSDDCNNNELPDECERDCNGNDIPDDCDIADDTSDDCDENGIPDECQPDFDGDGMIDGCDFDIDGDGVPNERDQCEFTRLGTPVDRNGRPISDTSGNCIVDLADLDRFINVCVTHGGPGVFQGVFCVGGFDYDGDFDVDLRDVAGLQNAFGW